MNVPHPNQTECRVLDMLSRPIKGLVVSSLGGRGFEKHLTGFANNRLSAVIGRLSKKQVNNVPS